MRNARAAVPEPDPLMMEVGVALIDLDDSCEPTMPVAATISVPRMGQGPNRAHTSRSTGVTPSKTSAPGVDIVSTSSRHSLRATQAASIADRERRTGGAVVRSGWVSTRFGAYRIGHNFRICVEALMQRGRSAIDRLA
jgi:hypothetical protein